MVTQIPPHGRRGLQNSMSCASSMLHFDKDTFSITELCALSARVEQLACVNRLVFLPHSITSEDATCTIIYSKQRWRVYLLARPTSQSMVDDAVKETAFALVRCASARPADA